MLPTLALALIWTLTRQNVDSGPANCTVMPCALPYPASISTFCAFNSTNYRLFDSLCFMDNYNCLNQNQTPYKKYNFDKPCDCPKKEYCESIAYFVDPTFCGYNGTHWMDFYGDCFLNLWNCKHTNQCPYKFARDGSCCDKHA